jgi:hypothetical protein
MVQFNSAIAAVAFLSLAGQAIAGGAIVGRLVSGLASGVAQGVVSNNSKMRRVVRADSSSSSAVTSTFSACMNAVEETGIHHVINPDHSVIVSGLPPVCITEVNTYNSLPNIADLNKSQGAVSVVNSTTIKVSGLPSALSDYLESLGKKQ